MTCIISYVNPCKSTVAIISLSFHMTMIGILMCLTYLWEFDLSVETDTLELMFIVTLFFAVMLGATYYFSESLFISDTSHFVEIMLWMILVCIVSYVKPCKSAVACLEFSFV